MSEIMICNNDIEYPLDALVEEGSPARYIIQSQCVYGARGKVCKYKSDCKHAVLKDWYDKNVKEK